MRTPHIVAMAALIGTSTVATASMPNTDNRSTTAQASTSLASRWRIEVRDTRAKPGDRDIGPTSGRLAAAFDLTIGGTPGRLGDNIPYVDASTLEIDGASGSFGTLTLRDGLTVSLSGTPETPMLHSEDVKVLSYDQVVTKGMVVTQPKVATTSIDMPFDPSGGPKVVGGYAVGKPGSRQMRVFVIRPI